MSWYDYVPGVANVAGAIKGDPAEALGGAGTTIIRNRKKITDAAGITNPAPEDLSKGPDAQKIRDFSDKLAGEYSNHQPAVVNTVSARPIAATSLDQGAADQARQTAQNNISGLEGVANGTTPTAADALLTRGTDAARNNATGLAAAMSRSNPGLALRAGLQAGNQASAQANAVAAQQKSAEQAQARSQIGSLADAMRGQDLGAAQYNANSANDIGKFNTTVGQDAQKTNQQAQLNQEQIANSYEINKGNQVQAGLIAPLNAAQAAQQAQIANQNANSQATGSLYTMLGGLSDKRAKEDVKPASLADALAENVHSVTYRYKPGMADGERHPGLLADDLEKAVPDLVKRRADGLKVVDTNHATLMNTGVLAELAKRLKAVEARG